LTSGQTPLFYVTILAALCIKGLNCVHSACLTLVVCIWPIQPSLSAGLYLSLLRVVIFTVKWSEYSALLQYYMQQTELLADRFWTDRVLSCSLYCRSGHIVFCWLCNLSLIAQ